MSSDDWSEERFDLNHKSIWQTHGARREKKNFKILDKLSYHSGCNMDLCHVMKEKKSYAQLYIGQRIHPISHREESLEKDSDYRVIQSPSTSSPNKGPAKKHNTVKHKGPCAYLYAPGFALYGDF